MSQERLTQQRFQQILTLANAGYTVTPTEAQELLTEILELQSANEQLTDALNRATANANVALEAFFASDVVLANTEADAAYLQEQLDEALDEIEQLEEDLDVTISQRDQANFDLAELEDDYDAIFEALNEAVRSAERSRRGVVALADFIIDLDTNLLNDLLTEHAPEVFNLELTADTSRIVESVEDFLLGLDVAA